MAEEKPRCPTILLGKELEDLWFVGNNIMLHQFDLVALHIERKSTIGIFENKKTWREFQTAIIFIFI